MRPPAAPCPPPLQHQPRSGAEISSSHTYASELKSPGQRFPTAERANGIKSIQIQVDSR